MALAEDVARLADELRHGSCNIKAEVTAFPSGAVSLRIRVSNRVFDLDYYPSLDVFGVDELEPDMGFDTGHRFNYSDFPSARARLFSLLEEAGVI